MKTVAVIGGGSWGTALSIVLAKAGHSVKLWVFEKELVTEINENRRNSLYMAEFSIPHGIEASNSLECCLREAEIVLTVVPSHHCRSVFGLMLPYLKRGMIFVSATKGLENQTLQRMSEVIQSVLPSDFSPRIAVISGPSFAKEVARGDPTALVAASQDRKVAELVQHEFSGPSLRLYTNCDVAGVEFGGAVKNVIALAAGACAALGYGSNSMAALITSGLEEMTRLALACGGKRETLAGLTGLGDLVLTCTGGLSRNRHVGFQLGQGQKLAEIVKNMRMVAEGIMTTRATLQLARKHQVEMPITEQMDYVLHQDKNPLEAIRDLMDRRLRDE